MAGSGAHRFDLRRLLAAVEAAPPIDVVDVLAAELAEMVGATRVSLLIANFSGTAINRLSHITDHDALRNGHNERVESLPLEGSAYLDVGAGHTAKPTLRSRTQSPAWGCTPPSRPALPPLGAPGQRHRRAGARR